MNTFAKIMIAGAATLATAVGTARIVSKVAKDQDDAFFTEHAENGVGLGGGFDLGSINHFSKAPTNVPEAEPVQDVAFEDENGQFVPLPEAEEPPAEPVTAPAEEAVPVIAAVPALEAPETEAPAEEEPVTEEAPAEEEPVTEEAPAVEEPTAEEPAPAVEEEPPVEEIVPVVEEPAPEEVETPVEAPASTEDHFEDIYSDSSKEEEAAQPEAAPAPQEPTPEVAPAKEETDSPRKRRGPKTIQVGNAIVSDDSSNGFIELVAQESGKAPEQLVVLASPKASLMVFSFSDVENRTENTLDAVYFVSEKGKVTESSAEERENVMAFARTFISHNQEFKNFLLR